MRKMLMQGKRLTAAFAIAGLGFAGVLACGSESEGGTRAAGETPIPRFVVGQKATAIIPDALGRADLVLPPGDVVLAFIPSTESRGTYGFSLSGVRAVVDSFQDTVTKTVSAAVRTVTRAAEPVQMALFDPPAIRPEFPASRTFTAPAGRNRSDFVQVSAVKLAEGERAVFYSEEDNELVRTVAQQLVDYVDRVVYPEETLMFGPVPDVDANGKIILLSTSAVNKYSNVPGQFTGGFFASKDLSGRTGTNNADMLYLYLPVPVAEGGVYDHAEDYRTLMQEVVVHELQHMINFAARLSRGSKLEEPWLNEGLSHYAEEHFGFSRSNRIRSGQFLVSTATTPLVGSCDTLSQRGAAFLFVKHLAERSGERDVLRRLVSSDLRGIANVEQATGRVFNETLRDWAAALADEYAGQIKMGEISGANVNTDLPQSAPAFYKVRGPGVLSLRAAPDGAFQGVGLALTTLKAPAAATTASAKEPML